MLCLFSALCIRLGLASGLRCEGVLMDNPFLHAANTGRQPEFQEIGIECAALLIN